MITTEVFVTESGLEIIQRKYGTAEEWEKRNDHESQKPPIWKD